MPTEELADQSFESIQPEEKPPKVEGEEIVAPGKFKIKLKMVLILAVIFFIFLIFLALLAGQKSPSKPPLTPTPTPTPFKEKITSPSAYATDSAILRMEKGLEIMEEKLQSVDLKETNLNPPVLDMDVNFRE